LVAQNEHFVEDNSLPRGQFLVAKEELNLPLIIENHFHRMVNRTGNVATVATATFYILKDNKAENIP
jgi:hypothetical protein